MKVIYSDNHRIAIFDGVKFRKDLKTGYYLSVRKTDIGRRERLHRYVWRYYNGDIADGYHIHHKDENKDNNEIENLDCITSSEHERLHSREYAAKNYDKMIKNLNENVRPKANEWHKSADGREWHKQHYSRMKDRLHETRDFVCVVCGKPFKSPNTKSKFCCNNCKSAYRRGLGVDNVKRVCVICGGEFIANKYSKTRTCSSGCKVKLRQNKINNQSAK